MKRISRVLCVAAGLVVLGGCAKGQYLRASVEMGRDFPPDVPISVTYEERLTRGGTEKKTTTTNFLQPGDAVIRRQ